MCTVHILFAQTRIQYLSLSLIYNIYYIRFLCYDMFLFLFWWFPHKRRFTKCLGCLQCLNVHSTAMRPFETVPRWMMMMQYQTQRQCLRRWRDTIFRCHQTSYLWISWFAGGHFHIIIYNSHKEAGDFLKLKRCIHSHNWRADFFGDSKCSAKQQLADYMMWPLNGLKKLWPFS